jgi:hypothetical protein
MQVSLDGLNVIIGMPVYGSPTTQTTMCLLQTVRNCALSGIPLDVHITTGFMPFVRDYVLDNFLKSDANRLFWIDSDMVWTWDDFVKMLAWSTKVDVIAATYPQKRKQTNEFVILYDDPPKAHPEFDLVEIHATGLGFSVWTRKVCEDLVKGKPMIRDGFSGQECAEVFSLTHRNGERHSEDVNAFKDIGALGHKVWLDPEISLGHLGQWKWRGNPAVLFKRKDEK